MSSDIEVTVTLKLEELEDVFWLATEARGLGDNEKAALRKVRDVLVENGVEIYGR